MQFNILVTGGLYSKQCAYSALAFCQAASAQGHIISQVFFYQDGVHQGNALSQPLDDEFEPVLGWAEFAAEHGAELLVCVASAERRGVINQQQADELALPSANLHSSFSIAGLGRLQEASLNADRTVTFK